VVDMLTMRVLVHFAAGARVFVSPRPILRRFRKIAKTDYVLGSSCPSVRPSAWKNSAPTVRILMKFDI
jgi:hypothetical protein